MLPGPNIIQEEAYYSNRIGMNWTALTIFLCVQRGHYLLKGGMAAICIMSFLLFLLLSQLIALEYSTSATLLSFLPITIVLFPLDTAKVGKPSPLQSASLPVNPPPPGWWYEHIDHRMPETGWWGVGRDKPAPWAPCWMAMSHYLMGEGGFEENRGQIGVLGVLFPSQEVGIACFLVVNKIH